MDKSEEDTNWVTSDHLGIPPIQATDNDDSTQVEHEVEMDDRDPRYTQDGNDIGEEEEDEDNVEEDEDPGEDHEFEIIDQVESEEEEGEDGTAARLNGKNEDPSGAKADDCQDEVGYSSSDDDEDRLDDAELHALLERGIDRNSIRQPEEPSEGNPVIKHKTVLKEFESDPFDILPEGWICVTHNCGMPIYLHKESRVCTMARPYSLGSASTRTHDIPISAIPCLLYKKQLDKFSEGGRDQASADAVGPDGDSRKSERIILQASQETNACPAASLLSPSSSTVPKQVFVAEETSGHERMFETETSQVEADVYSTMGNSGANKDISNETSNYGEGEGCVAVDDASLQLNKGVFMETMATERCSFDAGHANIALQSSGVSTSEENLSVQGIHCDGNLAVKKPTEESCGERALNCDTSKEDEEGKIVEETGSYEGDTPNQTTSIIHMRGTTTIPIQECSDTSPIFQEQSAASKLDAERASCDDTEPGATDIHAGAHVLKEPHLVREEEASGSQEPSELVTSNSNSLATIKRKIESLRNRRGGKLRRLDHGSGAGGGGGGASASAAGWSVENNVAVSSSLPFGDANTSALNASTTETLKANASVVKIKTAEERARESLLDSKTVQGYCSRLFHFKVIEVKKYSSWKERRKYLESKRKCNRPELPSSTKLITCPIPGSNTTEGGLGGPKKREFVLNPTGKSYLCILHEYMQRTLKIQPLYVFKELENSKTPYGATVIINNIEYGTGYASSKKVAKQEAAKETLKILIPDLFNKMSDQEIKRNISDLSFFDNVKVTDPRINELGNKVGQPSPFQILQECLRRNFGMGNTQCEVSTQPLKNQKCEYSIKVGKHSATVVAKNKRDGKQLAAQAILTKLHPHIPSWGSLLRLYGTSVEKPVQKPEEMNDVKSHAPNVSVLASLREEMRKLHKQKEAIQVKGKIIISSKDLPNKTAGVDL